MNSAIAARARAATAAIAFGALPAAVCGYALGSRSALLAPLAGAAAAVWLFASPRLAAVALGASLPLTQDVTGGRLGLNVAASDVLLIVLGARVLVDATLDRTPRLLNALRPVRVPVLQYGSMIVLLLAVHPGLSTFLRSGQRFELFALPLLVGAFLALRREHLHLLRIYVVGTSVLAIAWPLDLFHLHLELQKNPTGQFLANAVLLVVGLFLTASRGAILALAIGLVVITVMQSGRGRRVVIARTIVIAAVAAASFHWLPADVRTHVTSLSSNANTSTGYSLYLRSQYQAHAEQVIAEHPLIGVGVGQYRGAGGVTAGAPSLDPHNVVLLQAAEGGYLFAASFVLLVLGVLVVLRRLRRVELSVAAAAVLLATVAHGLFDVYWVRGTPVLGWLLLGMVCGLAWRERVADSQ